jgi:hypothetical protein
MATHFIGVTADQLPTAVRLWGAPDFTHAKATWSVLGDIPGEDRVVLGDKAFTLPKKWKKLVAHAEGL